jgi:hypothetical protein
MPQVAVLKDQLQMTALGVGMVFFWFPIPDCNLFLPLAFRQNGCYGEWKTAYPHGLSGPKLIEELLESVQDHIRAGTVLDEPLQWIMLGCWQRVDLKREVDVFVGYLSFRTMSFSSMTSYRLWRWQ